MPDYKRAARAKLRGAAADLTTTLDNLRALHALLPVSPQEEAMLEGEVEADFATEVRSVIECVIPDRLEPAIQALHEAAASRRKGRR